MNNHPDENAKSSGEKFVVDGANVCFWHKHQYTGRERVSVRPLLVLLCEIREHGDDFYCIFDHTIKNHLIVDREARLIEWLLAKYPSHFYRTAIDSRADPVILHYSDKPSYRIITNDRYRDFVKQFGWLAKRNTSRLVQGNYVQSGHMTLEKLSYGYMELPLNASTQVLVNRLVQCLDRGFDWRSIQAEKGAQVVAVDDKVKLAASKIGQPESAPAMPPNLKGRKKTARKKAPAEKTPINRRKALKAIKAKPKATVTPKTKKAAGVKGTKKHAPPRISKTTKKKAKRNRSAATRRTRWSGPKKKKGFFERLFG